MLTTLIDRQFTKLSHSPESQLLMRNINGYKNKSLRLFRIEGNL